MNYKTFEEWKAGQWLEDGEPRTKAYTKDELLLIEMGWQYGFDAGKVVELTPCKELRAFQEQQNGVFSDHNACCYRHECRIVWNDWEKLRSNLADLTDEEIKELSEKHLDMDWQTGVIEFAKAILRKAQEK
jgi:hypothetical protein